MMYVYESKFDFSSLGDKIVDEGFKAIARYTLEHSPSKEEHN